MGRKVILYPGDDGFIVAEVPSLPDCVSQGRTRDEALANIREAIVLYEDVLREHGEPVPEDKVEVVELGSDEGNESGMRAAKLEDSYNKLKALARKNDLLRD